MALDVQEDPFSCPICLDGLEDPVTIPCGHNYCLACIKDYWDQNEHTQTFSCPECRETFTSRPVLNKNAMFAQVVEQLKKAKIRDASPQTRKPDCCISSGQKCQAVGLCPKCKESYHEAFRNGANLREKHTVIVVSGEPRNNICLRHNVRMEIFCRTDQQFICSQCFAESHKGHDAVSVAPKDPERHNSQHVKTRRGSRDESGKHRRRKHEGGHVRRGSGGHRKRSRSKTAPETGHREIHGGTLQRQRRREGDGHTRKRHGDWHRSSRRQSSGH